LMVACEQKNEEAAALLMEATKNAGALDVQDDYFHQSALHIASQWGLESAVAKLLSLGADAALKNCGSKTALDVAGVYCEAKKEEVEAVFAKHYAQVDITDQNKNRLVLVFSRLGVASRLPAVLLAGADLKHTDEVCL